MLETRAPVIWNRLSGLICVYKPADKKAGQVRRAIITKLCAELNEMECREPEKYVAIEGSPSTNISVIVRENYADNILVAGPRYQVEDLRCGYSNHLGDDTSGVLLLGLRKGIELARWIRNNHPIRTFRVKGLLGQATDTAYKDGKVVERSTFRHVFNSHMDRLLANIQASHQKKMFELCGVDIQSQTAYELAAKGPIRPADSKIPVIYGIKCVEFEPPNFTLEIQCINETELYLKTLIHEIGVRLHSTAHCTGLQCIRHACFTVDHALLSRHWTLQDIIHNIDLCQTLLNENNFLTKQKSAALVKL